MFEYKDSDVGYIPDDWSAVRIGEFAKEISIRNKQNDRELPVLSVTKNSGIVLAKDYFKKSVHSKDTKNYKIIEQGQFAYATIHLDEGSIDVLNDYTAGIISPMYTVFETDKNKVDNKYLIYLLKSSFYISRYANLGQGSINRRMAIPFKVLSKLPIHFPPLKEQQKIAEILSSADEAIERTEAIIKQMEIVKKGLMQLLLTKGIGYTEFKHTEIGEVPESWEISNLGEVTQESAFGPRFSSSNYNNLGNYALLRTTDIDKNWNINYNSMPLAELPEERFTHHELKYNDLLISRSGTCGVVCIFKGFHKKVIPGAFLIRFRLNMKVIPEFLRLYMMSIKGQYDIQQMASGGVQKNLSGANLKKLLIPLPPLAEQGNIVTYISSFESKQNIENDKLNKLVTLKNSLMQSLLTGKVRVNLDKSEVLV